MADKPEVPQAAPALGAAAQGEIVTVFIGPEKKRYIVHQDVICYHSEYFRAAFNGRWKEFEEGVTLEDVEVKVFNLFVQWLYAKKLPTGSKSLLEIAVPDATCGNSLPERKSASKLLLMASVFGDRFLAPVFHRLAHNTFVNRFVMESGDHSSLAYEVVIWIYDNLPKGSPLIDLAVELQCVIWEIEDDDEEEKLLWPQLPQEFLLAVMLRQDELKGQECTDIKLNACDYHLHASEKEKKACQQNAKK